MKKSEEITPNKTCQKRKSECTKMREKKQKEELLPNQQQTLHHKLLILFISGAKP